MKQLTYIQILFLLLIGSVTFGQIQLGRQVIGSTGGYYQGANTTYSYTVGETVIQTQSTFSTSFIVTQGFQQVLGNDSIVDYEVINESCPGASNGSIFINNVLGCPPFPIFGYQTIIRSVDDTLIILTDKDLSAGDYIVEIIGGNGCTYQTIITVGLDSDEDCTLKFYSGITPNGDGRNDAWIIDNIEQFPENTVQIFNRWGQEVWWGENYDNDNVVWKGNNGNKDEGDQLDDATYFYVAIVKNFDKPFKGWVELTR